MKKFAFIFIFFITVIFLISCRTTSQSTLLADTRQIMPGRFDKVVIKGPMDVQLIAGIPENDIRLIGRKSEINRVLVTVKRDTLYVTESSGGSSKQRVLVVIRIPALYDLRYTGSGRMTGIGLDGPWLNADLNATGYVSLSGKHMNLTQLNLHGSADIQLQNVNSRNLVIRSSGNDRINITGIVHLNKIMLSGKSRVKILWIDSPELEIRNDDQSYLDLAGIAGTLDVILHGQAVFNGRYLRTHYAYVKTYDSSRADLQVTKVQNALASQSSNIYYYKSPTFLGTHMSQSGAVLDFDGMR